MTTGEIQKLIAIVTATYPTFYRNFDAEMSKNLVGAWYSALKEYEYKDACVALQKFIKSDKTGFPPSPGQVIGKMPSKYERYMKEIMEIEEHNYRRLKG